MNYELVYIVPFKYTEAEVPKIREKIIATLKKNNANIIREEDGGKRKIAYPIKQNRHGYFIILEIKIDPENLQKINQELLTFPEILRHQIVKFNPNKTKAPKGKEIEEITKEKITKEKDALSLEKPPVKTSGIRTETGRKKTGEGKIALEDLDIKLDEILSDKDLET
ncbi:30S ribosomal protein S6 [Candidatus Falkowbacteria bacterium]|nr:30S ribosomal protein S6 [Candidatus Falkowbacteria bacterium]